MPQHILEKINENRFKKDLFFFFPEATSDLHISLQGVVTRYLIGRYLFDRPTNQKNSLTNHSIIFSHLPNQRILIFVVSEGKW